MNPLLNHLKHEHRAYFDKVWRGRTRIEIHRLLDGMYWLKKYASDEWQYRHLFESPPPWLGEKVRVFEKPGRDDEDD